MTSLARGPGGARAAEIAASLTAVRARIAAACQAAGRRRRGHADRHHQDLPGQLISGILSSLGVHDVGENRDQEAAPKAAAVADLRDQLTWHFVGQLQTNKAASVARYADVIHSVDRLRLVTALGAAARKAGRTLRCLVQVSLDDEPGRGGAPADQVLAIADAVASRAGPAARRRDGGGAAGRRVGAAVGRGAFQRLAGIAALVRAEHPGAVMISAGMSGDLEDAIAAGATHVRVGTALLGGRPGFVR